MKAIVKTVVYTTLYTTQGSYSQLNNELLTIIVIALAITFAVEIVAIRSLIDHQAFAFDTTLTTPGHTVTLPQEGNPDAISENVGKGAPCEAFQIEDNPVTATFGKISC
jgi:hypothetical protein